MEKDEIELAYEFWQKRFLHGHCDDLVGPYLKLPRLQWIRHVREALCLKPETVASKMGVGRASYLKFERTESAGNIKLSTMKEIAEAMDCELIYAIRPKNRVRFSKLVWPQVYPDFLSHHWLQKCDSRRRAGALAFLAAEAMLSPKYRRAKGWCRKP